MKRVIQLQKKRLVLESNALTMFLYKDQFRTDFFADMLHLIKHLNVLTQLPDTEKVDDVINAIDTLDDSLISQIDLTLLYQFFFVFAKTANKDLTNITELLSTYSTLTLQTIINETIFMLEHSFKTKKK